MLTLTNAKLFDGTKMLPGRRSVSINGKCISAVGEQPMGGGGETIDVAGMTLMPGMITGHYHVDLWKYTFLHGSSGIMVGTELPPGVLMAIAVRNCGVLLDSGFTGYLGAACSHEADAQLKIAIAEGIIRGPRIRACGHHIGTTASINDHQKWWLRTEMRGQDQFGDGPEEMRKLVREDMRRGAQTIKIFATAGHGFPGAERPARNMASEEITAVVNAAHEHGAKVRAHVSGKEMVLECIKHGVDIIDHGDWIDEECIEEMVKGNVYWVPSLIYPKIAIELGLGDVDFIRSEYEYARRILPVAQKAGVKILVGDDYSGVFSEVVKDDPLDHQVGRYAREFAYYAGIEGISPADVLTWGTKNPGELLVDAPARIGVVEPGALADLIIVEGDPLQDLTLLSRPEVSLKAVIRDGVMVTDRLPAKSKRLAA
jgi:imidazolonepropionase-like amidohydrolase